MTVLAAYGVAALVVLSIVTLLWALSVPLKNASIIDMVWGLLFVAITWVLLPLAQPLTVRTYLLTLLVTFWGVRLSAHLVTRNLGQGEDSRYRRWRDRGGPHWWLISYFRVFLLQAAIALAVAAPIVAAFAHPHGFNLVNVAGVMVWALGFGVELLADVQLVQFKANPENRGRILDDGLWGRSRHPNYFGDAVMWWAYYLVALAAGAWWSIIGPVIMTWLLMRFSGVTLLERGLQKTRPQYADYVARTNTFFPGPPRSK